MRGTLPRGPKKTKGPSPHPGGPNRHASGCPGSAQARTSASQARPSPDKSQDRQTQADSGPRPERGGPANLVVVLATLFQL
jgi:hypothetical protein